METCVSKVCPFCQTDIQEGEAIKECPSCGAVYHERCWEQHKGCATVGCPEHPDVIPDVPVADVCPNCGAALGDDQNFCTQCGRLKVGEQQISCVNCGAELQMDQLFCPKCGAPTGNMAGVNTPPVVYPVNGAVVQKKSSAAKIVALIVAFVSGHFRCGGGGCIVDSAFAGVNRRFIGSRSVCAGIRKSGKRRKRRCTHRKSDCLSLQGCNRGIEGSFFFQTEKRLV